MKLLLLALLLGSCDSGPTPPQQQRGARMSVEEQADGLKTCERYVERLCACAEKDAARKDQCELARSQPSAMRMHMELLQNKQGRLKEEDRMHVEIGARKLIKACQDGDAALTGCPR